METVMTPTYIWMGIFIIAAAMFWGTALWAVVRGFIDILDIVASEKGKTLSRDAKGKEKV
jgi:hypothetical protein